VVGALRNSVELRLNFGGNVEQGRNSGKRTRARVARRRPAQTWSCRRLPLPNPTGANFFSREIFDAWFFFAKLTERDSVEQHVVRHFLETKVSTVKKTYFVHAKLANAGYYKVVRKIILPSKLSCNGSRSIFSRKLKTCTWDQCFYFKIISPKKMVKKNNFRY
jgi:hypothetical protein